MTTRIVVLQSHGMTVPLQPVSFEIIADTGIMSRRFGFNAGAGHPDLGVDNDLYQDDDIGFH